ncbi:MAG: hypothetical protein KF718_23800 [Polyangiaceae bacterium]|nr:hypothetical protein [Polyangiaceae bacterium]
MRFDVRARVACGSLAVAGLGPVACGEESPERAPALEAPEVPNPKSCAALREQGQASGPGQVLVSGVAARCLSEGGLCSLQDVSAFAAACGSGEVREAACEQTYWLLKCLAPADAGPD